MLKRNNVQQDAVPELQQDCAEIREELSLAADELGAHGEAQSTVNKAAETTAESLVRLESLLAGLEGESDDQRDAIGALMDLLEKTMTVDDASELSDQVRLLGFSRSFVLAFCSVLLTIRLDFRE